MPDTGRPYVGKAVKFMTAGEEGGCGLVVKVWSDTEVDLVGFKSGSTTVFAPTHVKKGDIDSGFPTWWENVVPR